MDRGPIENDPVAACEIAPRKNSTVATGPPCSLRAQLALARPGAALRSNDETGPFGAEAQSVERDCLPSSAAGLRSRVVRAERHFHVPPRTDKVTAPANLV